MGGGEAWGAGWGVVEEEEEEDVKVEGIEEEDDEEKEEGGGVEEEGAVLLVPMSPSTRSVLLLLRLSKLCSRPSLPLSFPPSFPSSSSTTSTPPDSSKRRIKSPFSRQSCVETSRDSHKRFSSIVDLPSSSPGLMGGGRKKGGKGGRKRGKEG